MRKPANPAHRPHPLSPASPRGGTGHQELAPVSAARLAAEAAFSRPAPAAVEAIHAQITVKRSRVARTAAVADDHAAGAAERPTEASAHKAPRVFRIENAADAATPPKALLAASPAPASSPEPTAEKPARVASTRRRRAAQQRPGPLVLVVCKPSAPQPPPLAQPFLQPTPLPQAQALAARLALVTPLVLAIEKAQSWQFIDAPYEGQYQRLFKEAEQLLQHLRASRR